MANLTRYNRPGRVMPLSEAMNELLRGAFTEPQAVGVGQDPLAGVIGMNLYEQDDRYILQVPLPGIKVDELNVTVRENMVTLQGRFEIAAPQGARSLVQGAGGGHFREQLVLPGDVDAENARAEYQEGILTLTLPKAAHAKERTIAVSQGQGQRQLGAQGQSQAQAQAQGQSQGQGQAQGQAQNRSQGQSGAGAQGQREGEAQRKPEPAASAGAGEERTSST